MANYNTFLVIDCKKRGVILATSSARKAYELLEKGRKIEVWNKNEMVLRVLARARLIRNNPFLPYIKAEKEFIKEKQKRAEAHNKGIRVMHF